MPWEVDMFVGLGVNTCTQVYIQILGGFNSIIFGFTPMEMIQFDEHIFAHWVETTT